MTRNSIFCSLCDDKINAKKDLVYVSGGQPAHWSCAEAANRAFTETRDDAFWQTLPDNTPATLFASRGTKKAGTMKIGYARVSRDEQSLDMQLAALKSAGCEKIFEDKISGARSARPGLDAMMDALRNGDEVVVWKMDRLGRTLVTMVSIMEKIAQKGAAVSSLTEPTLGTVGPHGKLVLHILCAVAEYELGLIAERTKAGVARARQRGKKMGRPSVLNLHQRQAIIEAVSTGRMTRAEAARVHKVSRPTVSRIMSEVEGA